METQIDRLGKVSITVDKDYWSINKDYDRLVIVERESTDTCYLSRKPVPAGIPLTNREYWIKFSRYQDVPYRIVDEFGADIESGISQRIVTEYINKILNNNIGVNVETSHSYVEKDTTTEVDLSVISIDGEIFDIKVYLNNTWTDSDSNTDEYTGTVSISDSSTIKFLITIGNIIITKSITIPAYYPTYMGFNVDIDDGDEIINNIVNDTYKLELKEDIKGSYPITNNNDTYSFQIAIPFTTNIKDIRMNGMSIPCEEEQSYNLVHGIPYIVYKSLNKYLIGNYIIDII